MTKVVPTNYSAVLCVPKYTRWFQPSRGLAIAFKHTVHYVCITYGYVILGLRVHCTDEFPK